MKRLLLVFGLLFSANAYSQNYLTEYNDTKAIIKPQVPIKAYPFNLQDVKLLESPFLTAMKADAAYLLKIDADRLLSSFRRHAGLQEKGKIYGGWESDGLAGHTLGHYLSALSMHYASTKDEAFLKKINYIVNELYECQKARKTGYVGAIPNEDKVWEEVAKGNIKTGGFDLNGAWAPWYTVHKIMAGLQDAFLYANNTKALQINQGIANWAENTIKGLDDAQIQKMLICEYGGMSEVMANTYAFTGDKKYLDLSYKFYDKRVLDTLANGKDQLAGKHSNTQIPKIIASARRYELTNNPKDLKIATFFYNAITKDHTYANGGNSNYEYLNAPGKLNDYLTDNTTETCNTYNMLKLTRHLFALNPEASYMDYYEKALYNHILASQNHNNGMTCYFVPLRMGGKKEFSDEFNTFTCCVGSGMENHVKYNESIYFRGSNGDLFVNLYIPSILNWKEKGITIKQETQLPASDLATFTINTTKPTKLTFRFRYPHWSKNFLVKINGKVEKDIVKSANGYVIISGTWKKNDKIELIIPSNLYTEAIPDNPNRRAVFYGPTLLAGVLGEKEPDPLKGVPVFVSSTNNANDWIKTTDKTKLHFVTNNLAKPNEVQLVPFNQVDNSYYSVYWDVFTPETWTIQQKVYEAAKLAEQKLLAQTMDMFRPGEMQPERDHKLIGERMQTGEEHLKKWRIAGVDGHLSFEMKVDENLTNSLMLMYWGMDNRDRRFDILVDGTQIASEDLNKFKESKFYNISYAIPAELTKGKKMVTIKLQPKPRNSAGPFYEARTIKN
ncbi:beta-L-arabinofuranosidase domain-containing protein [Pedobacter frigiditerrae]|uniref:beta-L-arabinofuranosidase domain-containing protein n=1 Tax=Pedobacter frigiditerrae TaxID=2530452 RepID=UPI00292DD905|nr:beta-L-arabinofuranosidase domain-containing protein [Pedobacter frigiditerrae]